jgi:hypothetical protein
VARRFSHKRFDELSPALAANKGQAFSFARTADTARLENCLSLEDGPIREVREIWQCRRSDP